MKKGGFFKSNWAYLIWFLFYFSISVFVVCSFIQNLGWSLFVALLIYGASVAFALSPLGESVARISEGIKPIQTQQDKDYLLPIFDEVYEEALRYTPKLNKDINLYIIDSMSVNAFALGRKTIAVTKGAVATFNREELKGILGHEFGHIVNGDTKALLIRLVGNGFFSIIVIALRLCTTVAQSVSNSLSGQNIVIDAVAFIIFMIKVLIDFFIFIFIFVGDIIISLNSRYSELLADEYSFLIGYGTELKNALYILDKISLHGKVTFTERLKSSHPYTSKRIGRLENFGA